MTAPLFNDSAQIEWRVSEGFTAYLDAVTQMEARVADIAAGRAREQAWLLEHPALYTAGTSAKSDDLIAPERFPVYKSGRGGQYTYHGPGQRVVYVMLDLSKRGKDIRCYVSQLEDWIKDSLLQLGVEAGRREGRIGVWVDRYDSAGVKRDEAKIAALGVRVRKWVTFHGISINLDPDLSHFSGIVPCGISQHGVTSLSDLGRGVSMDDLDAALRQCFTERFGPTIEI